MIDQFERLRSFADKAAPRIIGEQALGFAVVGIVSVLGTARSGDSELLNRRTSENSLGELMTRQHAYLTWGDSTKAPSRECMRSYCFSPM
jgi:hypothetical protein